MEGAASERGRLRKHKRHQRCKRESAADGFSKFVKAHEEREKLEAFYRDEEASQGEDAGDERTSASDERIWWGSQKEVPS